MLRRVIRDVDQTGATMVRTPACAVARSNVCITLPTILVKSFEADIRMSAPKRESRNAYFGRGVVCASPETLSTVFLRNGIAYVSPRHTTRAARLV